MHQASIGGILWQCPEELTRRQRKLLCGMHTCASFMRHSHPSKDACARRNGARTDLCETGQ